MPYVVTELCINGKYTDCVEICPVEAIHPGDQVPDECAHYEQWDESLANQWRDLGYNITEKSGPLDHAEEWEDKEKSEEDILTWDV